MRFGANEKGSPPRRVKNPPDPAPTPTPHAGPFVMSVEFPTPNADEPTYRVPYEEVRTIEEAVAWIRHPPFPPETLKKLKKGVLLTARMQAEWVQENGQRGEEIAAMGLVLRVGTKNVPAKIAVVTRDGISIDGEPVSADVLGLVTRKTRNVDVWLDRRSMVAELLRVCVGIPKPLLVLTMCAIARTVLNFVPSGENRPRLAIETAEDWARGKATLQQAQTVAGEAWDAIMAATEAAREAAWAARYALESVTENDMLRIVHRVVRSVRDAWLYNGGTDEANKTAAQRVQIVRSWIGLPGVAYAAITREK